MKILIIEDNDQIAQLLKTALEKWQYQVYLIKDFTNILAEVLAIDPQLVLLDLKLPSYNGYHWCSQIRQHSKVPMISGTWLWTG